MAAGWDRGILRDVEQDDRPVPTQDEAPLAPCASGAGHDAGSAAARHSVEAGVGQLMETYEILESIYSSAAAQGVEHDVTGYACGTANPVISQ